jgi:pimeloyl-ACP methyl ester carboxylesterase
VLLLHGFPENARMWDGVAGWLRSAGLRTIAPDQRGYSPGARPEEVDAYRMPALVGDVLGLLDAFGLPAVDLVGHDWGAVVGWHLAAWHPDRIRTLTAISVPHPAAQAWALEHDPAQRERSAYVGLFRKAGKAEDLLLADGGRRLRQMFAPLPEEAVDEFVAPMLAPGALTGALNWYRAIRRGEWDSLGPVQVPTTYVWGSADIAVGRPAAHRCAHHVAGPYRFVDLHGVSHWAPEQEPDRIAAEVLDRIGTAA